MVHRDLVGDYAENGRKRHGLAASAWVEKLHNSVDVASKNSHGDG